MAYGTRLGFEALRSAAFGVITNAYTALGTPTTGYTRLMNFVNDTDADMLISFDGVTDHLRIAFNSFQLFDCTTNRVTDDGFFLPKNTQIYIKFAAAPSTGNFWVEICEATAGGI